MQKCAFNFKKYHKNTIKAEKFRKMQKYSEKAVKFRIDSSSVSKLQRFTQQKVTKKCK
jgi:hypothetical protein